MARHGAVRFDKGGLVQVIASALGSNNGIPFANGIGFTDWLVVSCNAYIKGKVAPIVGKKAV